MSLKVNVNLQGEKLAINNETSVNWGVGNIAALNQLGKYQILSIEALLSKIKGITPENTNTPPDTPNEGKEEQKVADNGEKAENVVSETSSPAASENNNSTPLPIEAKHAEITPAVGTAGVESLSAHDGFGNLSNDTIINLALNTDINPSSMLTYYVVPSSLLSYSAPTSLAAMYSLNDPAFASLNDQDYGMILSDSGSARSPLSMSVVHTPYLFHTFGRPLPPSLASPVLELENSGSIVNVGPAENFFTKTATAISAIFHVEEKPKASTLGPVTNFKVADTSGFFSTTLVQQIPHVEVNNNHTSIVGTRSAFQDANNHYFLINPAGLQISNSSNSMATINLVGGANIVDTLYMLRKAATPPFLALNTTNTRAGSLIFNPIASTLAQAAPDKVNLVFSENNIFNFTDQRSAYVFAASNVPGNIATTVTGPANAVLLYNLLQGIIPTNPGSPPIFPISNYSPTSVITSLHNTRDIGGLGSTLVIDASNNLTTLIYRVDTTALTTKNFYWVDTSLVIHGQSTFVTIPNPGSVIDKGAYSYVHVGDANGDGITDLLFGSQNIDHAMLVYGAITFPALIHLNSPPASVHTTEFIFPDHNIVGVPIAPGANPADGGAALNAVATKTAGVTFVGDVNGDGFADMVVEKHSTDYSYDSDLAYIVYGQANYLPHSVELVPYGDTQLNHGIVGVGVDVNGNMVQNVQGFIVTGPTITTEGAVGPSNFSVKAVGDLNADGYDDTLAFANNNAAYVIFGHPTIGDISSNINLGVITPHLLPLFFLPHVATSTEVPSIANFSAGNINGDAFDDLIFSSAIPVNDLLNQTISFSKYLTAINNGNGSTALGSILSGAVFTDSYFTTHDNVSGVVGVPVGSAYIFKTAAGTFDTSHVIFGLTQSTIEGFTGIDNLIGGTGNQLLIEHSLGAIDPHLPGVVGSTLIGGNGNSIFEVADPAFHMVKGGAGFDILRLGSGTLDLTKVPDPTATSLTDRAAHIVLGIEKMELGNDTGLVLDPGSLQDIDNNSFNPTVSNILGTGGGATARGALLISTQNGANQDPNHAPTVDLYTDANHQWTLTGVGANISGLSHNVYVLGGPGLGFQQQTNVYIEQSIHVNVHSA